MIRVLGFDPSMNNWGIAEGYYDPSVKTIKVNRGYVIQPDKQMEKSKSVRKNSQDLNHATILASELDKALNRIRPNAIFVEVPVGSQNARAMCSYGMCIGLLSWIKNQGYPFYLLTPTDIKLGLNQTKTASKQDMIDAAVGFHPDMGWPMRGGKIIKAQAEHIADAIGAIHAGICLQEFTNLLALRNAS